MLAGVVSSGPNFLDLTITSMTRASAFGYLSVAELGHGSVESRVVPGWWTGAGNDKRLEDEPGGGKRLIYRALPCGAPGYKAVESRVRRSTRPLPPPGIPQRHRGLRGVQQCMLLSHLRRRRPRSPGALHRRVTCRHGLIDPSRVEVRVCLAAECAFGHLPQSYYNGVVAEEREH